MFDNGFFQSSLANAAAAFIFHRDINDIGHRVRPRDDGSGMFFFSFHPSHVHPPSPTQQPSA